MLPLTSNRLKLAESSVLKTHSLMRATRLAGGSSTLTGLLSKKMEAGVGFQPTELIIHQPNGFQDRPNNALWHPAETYKNGGENRI